MEEQEQDEAYEQWRAALGVLLSDAGRLAAWQERRYRFAWELGAALTGASGGAPALNGPALYGVFLPSTGLCYVGQTQETERRLNDLPVGESHHLATTVPPELWERVVVVRWPALLGSAPASDQEAAANSEAVVTGLALEYLLQLHFAPPLNSRRRHRDGAWRPRNLTGSKSRGALAALDLPGLWTLVRAAWLELAECPAPADGTSVVTSSAGRVVFPSAIHQGPSPLA
ncbi:hypothetical protein [Streptomyces sp. NPDC088674]|uniref:hypothetical protein n=1 Tax=Streptomyces sp. NPDC088674 TaxID=3365869 RepID=UPI00380DBCFF